MARHCTLTVTNGSRMAKVYDDSETAEMVIRLYVEGRLRPDADAFESYNPHVRFDRGRAAVAASDTAKAMVGLRP